MTFPQFANSTYMQIILAGLSLISSGVFNWTAFNFVQSFYKKDVEFEKKTNLLVAVSTILYVGSIYGAYAFDSFVCFDEATRLKLLIPSPILCVVVYIIMKSSGNLHRSKLINILRHSYLYSLCLATISLFISYQFVPRGPSYNYFINGVAVVLFIPLCLLIYVTAKYLIKYYNFEICIPNSMPENNKHDFLWSSIVALCGYVLTIHILAKTGGSLLAHIMVCVCLVLLLTCDMLMTYNNAVKYELENKNLYITSLMHTADNYLQFKTDFQNILEGYNSYIQSEDLEALAQYHQSLIEPTKLQVQSVSVAQKMPQNPSFVAVLLSKIDYAHQMNVNLFIGEMCSLENMHMEEFDLSRMLGNLLNNAIEAAALSTEREVYFSVGKKNARCKVIKLSNTTVGDVDLDNIVNYGVSTKGNHMGVGLTQVKNIAEKYPNCILNFEYSNNNFEVQIELSYAVVN